jgi:hypothetical protein
MMVFLTAALHGGSARAAEGAARTPPEEPALTNEDVVRMIASGMSEERVIARIRSSPAAYDLASDMLEELRGAGVPETVIAAMKERMKETAPAAPPAHGESPAPRGRFEVVFADDPKGTPSSNSATAPARAEDPNAPDKQGDVQLAFFVVCTYFLHVPDFWMNATPIPEGLGRHHVLLFEGSTVPARVGKETGYVFLEHPPRWGSDVEAGAHAGYAGVAFRVGSGPWLPMETKKFEGLSVEAGGVTRMTVRIRTRFTGKRESAPIAGNPPLTHIGTVGKATAKPTVTIDVVEISAPQPAS